MIINRDIINENIIYDGHSKQDICNRINRWKRLIKYNYGLKKGDTVCLLLLKVDINHIAAAIAIAELGMKLFLTNKPISMETIHATKMAIHGPMDLTIQSKDIYGEPWPPEHHELVRLYSKKICQEEEIYGIDSDEDITDNVEVSPDDPYLFGSTSGTKSTSKPILWSHKDCFFVSETNVKHTIRMTSQSVSYNTLNMHHTAAMLAYLLPALMVAETHYSMWVTKDNIPEYVDNIIKFGVDNTIVHIAILPSILQEIEKRKEEFTKRITFLCAGFSLTKNEYDVCKRLPVNFNSGYGATEIGGPTILFVDDKTEYIPKNIGKLVEGYKFHFEGDDIFVSSRLWNGEKRKIEDNITFDGENYYYEGRKEVLPDLHPFDFRPVLNDNFEDWLLLYRDGQPDLIIWNHEPVNFENSYIPLNRFCRKIFFLDKTQFMDSTKLSMEQVRAYVENN